MPRRLSPSIPILLRRTFIIGIIRAAFYGDITGVRTPIQEDALCKPESS